MRLIRTIEDLSAALRGTRPAFVPTMGALHEGHLALIRRATQIAGRHNEPVVVSIFVNPTQFGPNEDFTRYPRMLEADAAAATNAGATAIFAPDVATMYPPEQNLAASFFVPPIATQPHLEEAFRPTHFAGVCQVVSRLFDLVQPAAAIFGEKDYQQLQVIKAMTAHEATRWPGLQIIAHPTIREPDGLAMSSRNAYLQPEERTRALGLICALTAAQPANDPQTAEAAMHRELIARDLAVDYAVVRDAATLMPISSLTRPARALIAARLGKVRLIDNLALGPQK